jgi:Nif-specific regulatory protein
LEHRLIFINGPTLGASVQLDPTAATLTIGRDASRDVPVDDNLASRLHARLSYDGQGWQIEDCGSLNGTRVNSQPVQRAILESGDVIRIGDRLFIFLEDIPASENGQVPAPVFAASTRLTRLAPSKKETALLETLDRKSPVGTPRYVSLLCRLASDLHAERDADRLTLLVCQSLREATGAQVVHVWLAGPEGRLRLAGAVTQSGGQRTQDHLLASLVMENNEAVLMEADETGDRALRSAPAGPLKVGVSLGVPIPGRTRPRGAIACYQSTKAMGLEAEDLQFGVAVAHQFGMALENLEHREQLEQSNDQLRRRVANQTRLVGNCAEIRQLHDQLSRVAPTSATVLLLGESGTGKELVAQTIHELSPRASGPFVAVNCAAFTESLLESELFGHEAGAFTGAEQRRLGQFERAHRGTIFLDEVAEMSPACQAKLLRLLEGHPFCRLGSNQPIRVDVRLVAATHRDLKGLVAEKRFREDLYYRLRVIELCLPPLRDRGDDILELAVMFLQRFGRELGRGPRRLSREAAQAIASYDWPGNVRELRNAIERAVVLGQAEEVSTEDLGLLGSPAELRENQRLVSLQLAEQQHIQYVLDAVGGNKTRACQILDIGRGTLYKKLAALKVRGSEGP